MRYATALIAAFVVAALAPPAYPGAWVQKRGGYYFKVSGAYLSTTKEYNFKGDRVNIRQGQPGISETSYQDISFSGYLEYGASERLTVVASAPFKILTSKRTEQADEFSPTRRLEATNGGLGDLLLALRYSLVAGKIPISVQGGAKFPLGYDAMPDDQSAPLGSGKLDVEGYLLAGASLYPLPLYITGGAGYRLRTGDLADDVLLAIEGGGQYGRLQAKVTFDASLSTVEPRDLSSQTADGEVPTSTVTSAVDQDQFKLSPGIALAINDGVQVTAEVFHIVGGKDTVAGTTYAIGLVLRR
jgi:hypothetical protein